MSFGAFFPEDSDDGKEIRLRSHLKIGLRSRKGGRCFPFSFERIDAIDGIYGIYVFECPVPVRESVLVLSVPCERGFREFKEYRGV